MTELTLVRSGRKTEQDSPIPIVYDATETALWVQVDSPDEGVSLALVGKTGWWRLSWVTEPFNLLPARPVLPLDYYALPLAPGVDDHEAPHEPRAEAV